MGARTFEGPIGDAPPAGAPRFRGVAHLAAFVVAVPLGAAPNFGVFAAPDRRLVFSINDFDEPCPGRSSGT